MSDGVNFAEIADLWDARVVRGEPAEHVVDCGGNVADRRGELLPGAIVALQGDDSLSANPLHLPAAQPLVGLLLDASEVRGNDLEFETGTAGVQNKNIHRTTIVPGPRQPVY